MEEQERKDPALEFIAMFTRRATEAQSDAERSISRESKVVGLMPAAAALARRLAMLPSVAHISSVIVGSAYDNDYPLQVTIYLDPEHKDSPILREIVGAGIVSRIDKSKHWDGTSLDASFKLDSGLIVNVQGYVPQTCRVVESEEVVDASSDYFVDEDGKVKRRKKVSKVECTDDPAPASTTNGQM